MLYQKILYSLDDVTIIPDFLTSVNHRNNINVYYKDSNGNKYLPIFVSPMASVVNEQNYNIWEANNLLPILPRTESLEIRLNYALSNKWAAFSLEEFQNYFCKPVIFNDHDKKQAKVLIDMANGHMKSMADAVKTAKLYATDNNYEITIMVGNIANPETYRYLANAGADYVRVGIGNGNVCITSSNTGINYPMASLLDEINKIKKKDILYKTKVIADGGINSFSKVIKALALGADYVMIGSAFAKCYESAAEFIYTTDDVAYNLEDLNSTRFSMYFSEEAKRKIIKSCGILEKNVFGMSTRKAQALIQKANGVQDADIVTKTSEGIEKTITVDYTIAQWTENFCDYFKSNMSYCDCYDVKYYIGHPILYIQSESSKNSINK